ncbi:MAG: hypothetical protein COW42_01160 [Deltaproteobacteria bacterium CG17_big_fil_post_rev_8_21_14_2_50_63_7]|nr:MAG: hypothetical protein COW42_01160 [Deltaproteobacteria bacterium CG17_big_fil_post_rev_8_21_14_2_50_63_7]
MLRPTKHTDPARSLLFVSGFLLTRMQKMRVVAFTELRAHLLKKMGDTERLFVPALNLLYSLGLVEYRVQTDSFEYVGPA